MPVLNDSAPRSSASLPSPAGGRGAAWPTAGWLPVCSNPQCSSSWLRLWRTRHAPVFEGGWLCGADCVRARVRAAVVREMEGLDGPPAAHRHRVPLGLVLLSHGAVTRDQLRAALTRQRTAGGRLGMWLVREHGVEERAITRALGAQWGAPVLTLDNHSPEKVAAVVPRLFVDAFAFLPLRTAGGALLYLGFADRIDRSASFAIERMSGLRVEAGLVADRVFGPAHRRMLAAAFPPARLVEAAGVDGLVATLARAVEELRPAEARLVRMHDYFWLRMWRRAEGQGAAGPGAANPGAASLRAAGSRAGSAEDVIGSLAGARA